MWRLLDFGIAARASERVPARCTPLYAAPEVLRAADADADVVAHAATDMWALGVIAFEALTHGPAFEPGRRGADVFAAAAGRWRYPWEVAEAELPGVWRRSRLRGVTGACLARDPAARPSAQRMLDAMQRLGSATAFEVWGDDSGSAAALV